jgi:phage regulator Rha-like protein
MFKLTREEYKVLRCQTGTLKRGRHAKYLPYVFTEQGIAMLSSILNSKRAILVNIQIIRTFTKIRKMLLTHKDLKQKIEVMEEKYDGQFKIVFDAIRQLLTPHEKPKRRIGFHPHED